MNSYFIYYTSVIMSSIFASLSQKIGKKGKPNVLLFATSFLLLTFLMGLRSTSVGVDDLNYFRDYNMANNLSVLEYYLITPREPGYYLLNRLVFLLFDDFRFLIFITSFITILFFYLFFYSQNSKISLGLAVLIFSSTQYFFYFGIIRLGLAVSIVSYGYTFLINQNKKKFVFFVFLASMFHFSALFNVCFLLLNTKYGHNYGSKSVGKVLIIIPFIFLVIKQIMGDVGKYQGYLENSSLFSLGFITSLPFLILGVIYYKISKKNNLNFRFYMVLVYLKIMIEIFGPYIGMSRMIWYVNIGICCIIASAYKTSKEIFIKNLIVLLTVLYCIMYSYFSYFGNSSRSKYMMPYKTILFSQE